LPADAAAKQLMAHNLKNPQGDRLYRLRKQIVEPVSGIIKQCMRFRQFLMRGKGNVSNEWNLVYTAYNLKRTFNLINAGQAPAWSQHPRIAHPMAENSQQKAPAKAGIYHPNKQHGSNRSN